MGQGGVRGAEGAGCLVSEQTLPCPQLLLLSPLCPVFPPFLIGHPINHFWEACLLCSLWLGCPGPWGQCAQELLKSGAERESTRARKEGLTPQCLCSWVLCVSLALREIIIRRKVFC